MTKGARIYDAFSKALELHRIGHLEQAEKTYLSILEEHPDFVPALINVGALLRTRGKPQEAVQFYERALAQIPQDASVYSNLGHALTNLGRYPEALESLQRAIEINPRMDTTYDNLAFLLNKLNRFQEAADAGEKAVRLNPANANAWNNLASSYQRQARIEEAIGAYRKAAEINPGLAMAHSNVLFCMLFSPRYSPEQIAEAHRVWARQRASHLVIRAHPASPRDPNKKPLRVGFLSPDLRVHPVGSFLAPVFRSRNIEEWQAICYSDVLVPDRMTEWFRSAADAWRNIAGLSNEEVARLVASDEIDILFDMAGHTGDNRLLLFARKVAPVQVTWMGYLHTSGLSTMDYLIADATCIPEGEEHFYAEKILRMPDGLFCYDPPEFAPLVNPLPAIERGYVTFGSMNQLAKVRPEVIRLWSRLLSALPTSRIVFRARALNDKAGRDRLALQFAACGISEHRIDMLPHTSLPEYFETYHEVDIHLDPFPYAGGTTTCDALWMGVPTVTLAGDRFCTRHSASHLRNAGLGELVAGNVNGYLGIAMGLASDLDRLGEMRAGMREKIARSPLLDAERFGENFTGCLRTMWGRKTSLEIGSEVITSARTRKALGKVFAMQRWDSPISARRNQCTVLCTALVRWIGTA
jgi:protein O-GlcNAc transferase